MAKADTNLPLLVTIRYGDSLWLIGGGNLVEFASDCEQMTLTARVGFSPVPRALNGADCTARVLWRDDEELSISGVATLGDDARLLQHGGNYSITISTNPLA